MKISSNQRESKIKTHGNPSHQPTNTPDHRNIFVCLHRRYCSILWFYLPTQCLHIWQKLKTPPTLRRSVRVGYCQCGRILCTPSVSYQTLFDWLKLNPYKIQLNIHAGYLVIYWRNSVVQLDVPKWWQVGTCLFSDFPSRLVEEVT